MPVSRPKPPAVWSPMEETTALPPLRRIADSLKQLIGPPASSRPPPRASLPESDPLPLAPLAGGDAASSHGHSAIRNSFGCASAVHGSGALMMRGKK